MTEPRDDRAHDKTDPGLKPLDPDRTLITGRLAEPLPSTPDPDATLIAPLPELRPSGADPDRTQITLGAGEPGPGPSAPPEPAGLDPNKTHPGLVPDDLSTRRLRIAPAPAPVSASAAAEHPTLPSGAIPALPEARPQPSPAPVRGSRIKYWAFGILALLILGGSLAYYFLYPNPEVPAIGKAPEAEEVPASLRPYLDKANQGDPSAMRMLGTMYYNGLNVTQDRKEGIKWYRKAAAAGSVAARRDLEQLGLNPDEK